MKTGRKRFRVSLLLFSLMTGCALLADPAGSIAAGGTSQNPAKKAAVRKGSITVDGDFIRTDNVNGLTFKGFGLLSGNSTSDLLMDYKSEHPEAYARLMQYLFGGEYPIMNHVKLEMGNDCNNSTGPESATKRSREETANVRRNPGWQLAADAKKIHPGVKISILRWNQPAWVKTDEDIYTWYKETILQAYETYGFMVDYINPNINERWRNKTDVSFTKKFAGWIAAENEQTIPDDTARELFRQIKLIVSDEAGTVSSSVAEHLKTDADFLDAVSVVGYHYSPEDDANGGMTWLAEEIDKEVWNSEAQATFSNSAFRPANNMKDPSVAGTGIGGAGSCLEMGNTFIKGFVKSRRSHVIYQPAIGAFYEGGQYSFKELVSARDPWSGWMHYDAGLLVLAHLSKFAKTGWENEQNTAGIWRAVPEASHSEALGTNPVNGRNGGENYMTLASPAKDHFSTVIVNDSEYEMSYDISVKNMNINEPAGLHIWETSAAGRTGAFNENYMKYTGAVSADGDGLYTVSVKPYSIVTVTTLDVSESEEHTAALPVEGTRSVLDTDSTGAVSDASDPVLYADDFNYTGKTVPVLDGKGSFTNQTEDYIASRGGDTGAIARYTHTINGAFEVYKTESGNYVLRQQLDQDEYGVGGAWNAGDPVVVIGDFRWMNYTAAVDVCFENGTKSPYAAVAIRQTGASHKIEESSGYTLKVSATGEWELYRKSEVVLSGTAAGEEYFKTGADVWNRLALEGDNHIIRAYINDALIATYEDPNPITAGRIALGSAYTFTQFDNLTVTKLEGRVPYYTELLDNLETYDLTPERNDKLIYNDWWSHKNGQGMYVYQRSLSTSTKPGATLSYTFSGTGLEILAGTKETATLLVTVDGAVVSEDAVTQTADDMNMVYSLRGLDYGTHTVTLEVIDGTLSVDLVGVLGQAYEKPPAPTVPPTPPATQQPSPPANTGQATASPSAGPNTPPAPQPFVSASPIKKGAVVTVGQAKYLVTNVTKKEVSYKQPTKKTISTAVVPDTVMIAENGKKTAFKVTAIHKNAFIGCRKLKSAAIGKHVKTIGKNAWNGCRNLKQIKIASTVLKKAGANAFKGIHPNAVITCKKTKLRSYAKLFRAGTGIKKTMKLKKR